MFARKSISSNAPAARRVPAVCIGLLIAMQSASALATGTTPSARLALAAPRDAIRSGVIRPNVVAQDRNRLSQRDTCIPYLIAGMEDNGATSGTRDPNQRKRRCRVYLIVDRPESPRSLAATLS